jgi:hypothetical protein
MSGGERRGRKGDRAAEVAEAVAAELLGAGPFIERLEAIAGHLVGKLELIGCHGSQARSRVYPEEDPVVSMARDWGWFGGSPYPEPFEVARDVHGAGAGRAHDGPVPAGAAGEQPEVREIGAGRVG